MGPFLRLMIKHINKLMVDVEMGFLIGPLEEFFLFFFRKNVCLRLLQLIQNFL